MTEISRSAQVARLGTDVVSVKDFGAKGDGVTDDTAAIQAAIDSGLNVKGLEGDVYIISNQITLPVNSDIRLDFTGCELVRDASYITAESMFLATTGSGSISIKAGTITDASGVSGESAGVFEFRGRTDLTLSHGRCTSNSFLYLLSDCNKIDIYKNSWVPHTPNAMPATCRAINGKNCSDVTVHHNYIEGGAAGMQWVGTGSGNTQSDINIHSNTLDGCTDGGIQVRLIGTGGNNLNRVNITNNILKDMGKSAIKFTAPQTAAGTSSLKQAVISNNNIGGFALSVASPAIAVFRDAADTSISINAVIIANNNIDGRGTNGNLTSLSTPTDARGIRCSYVDGAILTGNFIEYVASDGITLDNCNDMSIQGGYVRHSNQLTGTGSGGISITNSTGGSIDTTVSNVANGLSGLLLNKARELDIRGTFNDNSGWGVNEDGAGASGVKSGKSKISVTTLRNTLGSIRQFGEDSTSASAQSNCYDDEGDRHQGTPTRRNAISANWGSSRNTGYTFWDTVNNEFELWNGSSWVKYDGSTVTS